MAPPWACYDRSMNGGLRIWLAATPVSLCQLRPGAPQFSCSFLQRRWRLGQEGAATKSKVDFRV
jgi:hypothetical protein